MEELIKNLNSYTQSLINIRDLFNRCPGLERIKIEYDTEEDGGDLVRDIMVLFINDAQYDLCDDGISMTEVEDGILDKLTLGILKDNLDNLLYVIATYDGDCGEIEFNQNNMVGLDLKLI